MQVADRIYSGVGEGDGELGCVSDDSALGDAIALIFFFVVFGTMHARLGLVLPCFFRLFEHPTGSGHE